MPSLEATAIILKNTDALSEITGGNETGAQEIVQTQIAELQPCNGWINYAPLAWRLFQHHPVVPLLRYGTNARGENVPYIRRVFDWCGRMDPNPLFYLSNFLMITPLSTPLQVPLSTEITYQTKDVFFLFGRTCFESYKNYLKFGFSIRYVSNYPPMGSERLEGDVTVYRRDIEDFEIYKYPSNSLADKNSDACVFELYRRFIENIHERKVYEYVDSAPTDFQRRTRVRNIERMRELIQESSSSSSVISEWQKTAITSSFTGEVFEPSCETYLPSWALRYNPFDISVCVASTILHSWVGDFSSILSYMKDDMNEVRVLDSLDSHESFELVFCIERFLASYSHLESNYKVLMLASVSRLKFENPIRLRSDTDSAYITALQMLFLAPYALSSTKTAILFDNKFSSFLKEVLKMGETYDRKTMRDALGIIGLTFSIRKSLETIVNEFLASKHLNKFLFQPYILHPIDSNIKHCYVKFVRRKRMADIDPKMQGLRLAAVVLKSRTKNKYTMELKTTCFSAWSYRTFPLEICEFEDSSKPVYAVYTIPVDEPIFSGEYV